MVFYGTEKSGSLDTELKAYCNHDNEIFISIDDKATEPTYLCLDKPTAIKLTRVLKAEISKIQNDER